MKKIALVMDGWGRYITYAWIKGIMDRIKETDEEVSLYIFNSSGNWLNDMAYNMAEYNIYNLPNLSAFDAIVLELLNVSVDPVRIEIINKALKSGVPVFSINMKIEGAYFVGIDNYRAEKQMVSHMILKHKCRRFWCFMGPSLNFENRERIRAIRDCLGENNIGINDKYISCGSYEFENGYNSFVRFFNQEGSIPDAIICGNDNIAVGVYEAAISRGFSAPQDFCLSGFDNFDDAGFYSPRISTISTGRENIGHQCMDLILRLWDGFEIPKESYVDYGLIFQDSCGCERPQRNLREYKRETVLTNIYNEYFMRSLLHFTSELRQCSNVEDLVNFLPMLVPEIKCSGLYIVLDDNIHSFKKNRQVQDPYQEHENLFKRDGYPDKMQVAFAYEKNERRSKAGEEITSLFPFFEDKKTRNYLFLPIHFEEYTVGYIVVRDGDYIMNRQYWFNFATNINSSLENLYRKEELAYMNQKLSVQSMTDYLTGCYNRLGQQTLGIKFYEYRKAAGKSVVLMYADLDGLKNINDNYGHDSGDVAIKALSAALKNFADSEAIIARIGGDEFMIIQEYHSQNGVDEFIGNIRNYVSEVQKKQSLPYQLSVSIGYEITDPGMSCSFEEYIVRAEKKMYKEKMKKKNRRK
ncbi:MAG: GGDEF domain-containing protein [Butyrivibrio sp.]|nr:GGDEF domain-containing protein [Butyrivibrio sp.]